MSNTDPKRPADLHLMSLADAAELLPERYGIVRSQRTLQRYATVGLQGLRLRTNHFGQTTLVWLDQFFHAPKPDAGGQPTTGVFAPQ